MKEKAKNHGMMREGSRNSTHPDLGLLSFRRQKFVLLTVLVAFAMIAVPLTVTTDEVSASNYAVSDAASFSDAYNSAANGDTITVTQSFTTTGELDINKDVTIEIAAGMTLTLGSGYNFDTNYPIVLERTAKIDVNGITLERLPHTGNQDDPTKDVYFVFANGNHLMAVNDGNEFTRIGVCDEVGNIDQPTFSANLSNYYVMGGKNGDSVTNSTVTVSSGTFKGVAGGGYGAAQVTGTATVDIDGGTIDYVAGAGWSLNEAQDTVAEMTNRVAAVDLNISGGNIGVVAGGGLFGYTYVGTTDVNIVGGTIGQIIAGGINGYTGTAVLNISGNTEVKNGGYTVDENTGYGLITAANRGQIENVSIQVTGLADTSKVIVTPGALYEATRSDGGTNAEIGSSSLKITPNVQCTVMNILGTDTNDHVNPWGTAISGPLSNTNLTLDLKYRAIVACDLVGTTLTSGDYSIAAERSLTITSGTLVVGGVSSFKNNGSLIFGNDSGDGGGILVGEILDEISNEILGMTVYKEPHTDYPADRTKDVPFVFANGNYLLVSADETLTKIGVTVDGNTYSGSTYSGDFSEFYIMGGKSGSNVADTHVAVKGGVVKGVAGGGYGAAQVTGTATVDIDGGTIDYVAGAGWSLNEAQDTVAEMTNRVAAVDLNISGGNIGVVAGGGLFGNTYVGSVDADITGGIIGEIIAGGINGYTDVTEVTINNAKVIAGGYNIGDETGFGLITAANRGQIRSSTINIVSLDATSKVIITPAALYEATHLNGGTNAEIESSTLNITSLGCERKILLGTDTNDHVNPWGTAISGPLSDSDLTLSLAGNAIEAYDLVGRMLTTGAYTVASGRTWTIDDGSLSVPEGSTMTNNGTFQFDVTLTTSTGITGFQTSSDGVDYIPYSSTMSADYGDSLWIKAILSEGHTFTQWSEGVTANPYRITSISASVSYIPTTVPFTTVTAVVITDITAPVAGETPDAECVLMPTHASSVTGTAVIWGGSPTVFGYSTVYTATVVLAASEGYTFGNDGAFSGATVNGSAATSATVSNSGATLTVTYRFAATGTSPDGPGGSGGSTTPIQPAPSQPTEVINPDGSKTSTTTTTTGTTKQTVDTTESEDGTVLRTEASLNDTKTGVTTSAVRSDNETKIETFIPSDTKVEENKAVAEITSDVVDVALDQVRKASDAAGIEDAKPMVEIKSTVSTEVKETIVEVPAASLMNVADAGAELKISSSTGEIVLDNDAVRKIAGTSGEKVEITVGEATKTDLTPAQQERAGSNPVFKLSAIVGETSVHELGGKAIITMDYTPVAGEDMTGKKVYYVNDDGEMFERVTSYVNGKLTFETATFSYYVLADADQDVGGSSDNTMLYISIAIAAIVIVGLVTYLGYFRLRKA